MKYAKLSHITYEAHSYKPQFSLGFPLYLPITAITFLYHTSLFINAKFVVRPQLLAMPAHNFKKATTGVIVIS